MHGLSPECSGEPDLRLQGERQCGGHHEVDRLDPCRACDGHDRTLARGIATVPPTTGGDEPVTGWMCGTHLAAEAR